MFFKFREVKQYNTPQWNHHKITRSFSFAKLHFTWTHCFKTITNSSENKCYICQRKLFPTFTYNGKVIWLLNWEPAYWFAPVNCSFYSTTVDNFKVKHIVSPDYLFPPQKGPFLLASSLIKIAIRVPLVKVATPRRPSGHSVEPVFL